MIDASAVDAIVEQYARHGWTLRRILVTEDPEDELISQFPNIEILRSGIDAVWFSRINRSSETWELRRLAGSPFALVQSIENGMFRQERDILLHEIELRMANTLQTSGSENRREK
ncbi:MAG: hypothetical protein DMF62_06190 [Acidobacteria bacterium]|nr:MAG: hypothetical protein DMF62_06190 [Acidobacteriota bacterium]